MIAGSAVSGKVGVWRMVGQHFSLLSYTGPVEFVLWSPFDDFLFTSHAYVDLRENRISSGGRCAVRKRGREAENVELSLISIVEVF